LKTLQVSKMKSLMSRHAQNVWFTLPQTLQKKLSYKKERKFKVSETIKVMK